MLEFSYLLIYIIYLLRVGGCKVLFQYIKAQIYSHPRHDHYVWSLFVCFLTSGRSHFYTCRCGAKGSSDQKPTSGVGLGAGDWCTGKADDFWVAGGKGAAAHMSSHLFIWRRKVSTWSTFGPSVLRSPEDRREWPLPGDRAGRPSFPLRFSLDVDRKSYFSVLFLFPSCLLLPREVVWASISLAEGSFIYSLVRCIFNTIFYSTNYYGPLTFWQV